MSAAEQAASAGMNETATIIIAILTSGLVSSLVTLAVNHLLITKREKNQFLRDKIENLFKSYRIHSHNLNGYFLSMESFLHGRMLYIDALKTANESSSSDGRDYHNYEILIVLYFPKLEDQYRDITKCQRRLNDIISEGYKLEQLGEQPSRSIQASFRKEIGNLEKRFSALEEKIIAVAKSIPYA